MNPLLGFYFFIYLFFVMRLCYGEQKQTCVRGIELAKTRCDRFLVIRLLGVQSTFPSPAASGGVRGGGGGGGEEEEEG